MQNIEKKTIEQYLLKASRELVLFPGFELAMEGDGPVTLGSGGSSYVYMMTSSKRPGTYYALKVTGFSENSGTSEDFWNSSRIQRILCEENDFVVRTISAVELVIDTGTDTVTAFSDTVSEKWEEEENRLHLRCLLMEKLEPVIKKDRFGNAEVCDKLSGSENEIINMAMEIGLALMNAHHSGVLHRDIKLENILYDRSTKKYKLGDFSMAKYTGGERAETVVYTDGYGAPEIERHFYDSYNNTADIYSFGITLYLLFNDLRFPGSDGYYPRSELQYSPDYVFPAPAHASAGLTRIIRKMCSFKPEDRYRFLGDALTEMIACVRKNSAPETEGRSGITGTETERYFGEVETVTETFREGSEPACEKTGSDKARHTRSEVRALLEASRFADDFYSKILMAVLTLLFIPLYEIHNTGYVISRPLFWLLPAGLLAEALFQKIREFHILSAVVFEAFIILYAFDNTVSVPAILSAVIVLFGMYELTFAAGVSLFVWMILAAGGRSVLPGLMSYRISQIILVIFVLIALAAFLFIRFIFRQDRKAIIDNR